MNFGIIWKPSVLRLILYQIIKPKIYPSADMFLKHKDEAMKKYKDKNHDTK